MSQVFRRYRDVDIVSTTNPGSTLADVVENIQVNYQTATKYFQPLSGLVDGLNKVFSIAETPDEGSVLVYLNGQLLKPGTLNENDYEIAGANLTFTDAPSLESTLWVHFKVTAVV